MRAAFTHSHKDDRVIFLHYRANENPEFVHLHLIGLHYTPYFPVTEDTPGQLERNIASEGAMDETQIEESLPTSTHRTGLMTRYLVAEARPSHMMPPWLIDGDSNGTFTHVQQLDAQPFPYKENLVYHYQQTYTSKRKCYRPF